MLITGCAGFLLLGVWLLYRGFTDLNSEERIAGALRAQGRYADAAGGHSSAGVEIGFGVTCVLGSTIVFLLSLLG